MHVNDSFVSISVCLRSSLYSIVGPIKNVYLCMWRRQDDSEQDCLSFRQPCTLEGIFLYFFVAFSCVFPTSQALPTSVYRAPGHVHNTTVIIRLTNK